MNPKRNNDVDQTSTVLTSHYRTAPVRVLAVLCLVAFVAVTLLLAGCARMQHDNIRAAGINTQLGLALLQRGDRVRARQKCLLATQLAPHDPSVWYSYAYLLEKSSDIPQAEQCYQHAISLNTSAGASHNNYGTFLYRQNRYRAALQQFRMALADKNYLYPDKAKQHIMLCLKETE